MAGDLYLGSRLSQSEINCSQTKKVSIMKYQLIKKFPITWLYFFFFFFSGVFQLFLFFSGHSGFSGLRESLIYGALPLIPILLWPHKVKLLAALIGLSMLAAASASLGYWMIYGQEFSQSAIFIIFESNMAESYEFITSYLRWWHVFIFVVFSIIPIFIWKNIQPITMSAPKRYALATFFLLISVWPAINTGLIKRAGYDEGVYHLMQRMEPAAPWNLVFGYTKYKAQLAAMQNLLDENNHTPPLAEFSESNSESTKTLVLVIGESTNRQRMSLYGYSRKTTPRLDALRDELFVFDDVVTPRPYTIEALQQVLSFADSKHPEDFFLKPTLLNMMKQAGYEVSWITNQQTQTRRNTMLTMLSQMADYQVYLNNNRTQNASQYDEVVIDPFIAVLNTPAKKKLIVIHLLGTHRAYAYRYPQQYDQFSSAKDAPPWIRNEILEEYNSYDNSILYNDYVVSALIEELKKTQENSALVYLSDHGEEVFDTPAHLFTGRDEANPLPAMYTIPFMVWASPKYKAVNETGSWSNYETRPYTSADFIYTWADIAGIEFKAMDHSRSVLSEHFSLKPRWIGNPANQNSLKDYSVIEKVTEKLVLKM